MTVHLVSDIATPEHGSVTLRIGDLNQDGSPDLLFVQSAYGPRTIQCLTAVTIAGDRLWQAGDPSPARGGVYSDLPVQIYDWDDDGVNEVLYVRQAGYVEPPIATDDERTIRERADRYEGDATLVVLDGLTGALKRTLALPAPADDSILFADLTGRGRREDLVVKDRYWNVWGVTREGETLWRWRGATGHYPAAADIDGDGRDEIFLGYALLDHDGSVLFDHQAGEDPDVHSDANAMVRLADGSWRLLFGNHGARCLAPDGRELWGHAMREAQHVVVGRYSQATALQAMVIDRGYPRNTQGAATVHLFDVATGEELWRRREPPGAWCANGQDIRWTGRPGLQDILITGRGEDRPAIILDGDGELVDELEVPQAYCGAYDAGSLGGVNTGVHYGYRADLCGDSREEAIIVGWKGARIYANARALPDPAQFNSTVYRGNPLPPFQAGT